MSVKNAANGLLRWLMIIIIGTMAIMVFLNVVLRYGFNSNLTITEEIGRYLFVWLTFLGSISAFIRDRHVRVDTFYQRMPAGLQRLVRIFSDLAMLSCCVLVILGCWKLVQLNKTNYLPVSDVPVSVLYFAGIPCCIVIGAILLCRLWRTVSNFEQGVRQ